MTHKYVGFIKAMVTLALSPDRKKMPLTSSEWNFWVTHPCSASYADVSSEYESHYEESFPCFGQGSPKQINYLIYSKGIFCLHAIL